jgi:hypothetical protein
MQPENFESWLAWREGAERPVPGSVEEELRDYPECGILCFGFARVVCTGCGTGFVVAFSCKGRGVCPSCNGRHMAQTDLATVTERVRRRVIRWFRLRRLLDAAAAADMLAWEHSGFSVDASVRRPTASSSCRRLSSSTGPRISCRCRGSTGTATTASLPRITRSGGPSQRWTSGTLAISARYRDRWACGRLERVRLTCIAGSGAAKVAASRSCGLSLMAEAAIGSSSVRRPPSPTPSGLPKHRYS